MVHLRIVVPFHSSDRAVELLTTDDSVCNVIFLPAASRRPDGDVILCDVAREDASVVLADLRELGIHKEGSIAIEQIDTEISAAADRAVKAAAGLASDAVLWEEVEARTSETAELSASFVIFMILAALIAAVGIMLDTPILIVGAMVVGPEFGPIAGFCVAAVAGRKALALRSGLALVVGFPAAITAAFLFALIVKGFDQTPATFSETGSTLASVISNPDGYAAFVAFCAGMAGVLSLSTAKSGALIGVLISVTTIPAAANIGVTAAFHNWDAWRGSQEQLAINLAGILTAGILTLAVQRLLYARRRRAHLRSRAPAGAGARDGL